ncbi:DUF4924 family protein [Algoriphagus hitonicola]|uniref:DUF4924 domain-containing protein n=1 Tax=Algoriphagus hitonicola TaxID=435880 RepID=A0A1I2SZZ5_9BACT|nr:DUF4924 family protein [Algoriphagus hitonicola]SFG55521.1 protein of unknown function [Algoriphagus hitonicola]
MKSVAESKKSQNIAEYIIYLYQQEDLIRSFQGNLEEIKQYVVAHFPVSDQEKEVIFHWYRDFRNQMEKEGILKKGHLEETQKLVNELSQIHWQLLKTDKTYFESYQKAKPYILQAVMEAEGKDLGNEIQICLNGVYGLLLCRLLGKTVSDEQMKSAEAFGEVLSLLNLVYQQEKISRN